MFSLDRLKSAAKREKRNLTYCASVIDKTHTYFHDLKRHGREPSQEQIDKLAAALNTTSDYLCCATDDPNPPHTGENIAVGFFGEVNSSELNSVRLIREQIVDINMITAALQRMTPEEVAAWKQVILNKANDK